MLRLDTGLREQRASAGRAARRAAGATAEPAWQVHDADGHRDAARRAGPQSRGPGDRRPGRRRGGGRPRGHAGAAERLGAQLLRRRGRHRGDDGPLRPGLRQRVLGRHPAGLRRRRRCALRALHRARRRAGPRARPRLDPVHRRARLLPSARGPQRVDVRRRRGVREAAAARRGRRRRRLADRGGHLRRRGAGRGAALHGRAGNGVRRPPAGTRPAAGAHGRLRRDHRRQRWGPHQLRHPEQGVPPGRDRHRGHQLGGGRADLVRRAHLRHPGHLRLRAVRGRHGGRRRGARGGRGERLGAGGRDAGRRRRCRPPTVRSAPRRAPSP